MRKINICLDKNQIIQLQINGTVPNSFSVSPMYVYVSPKLDLNTSIEEGVHHGSCPWAGLTGMKTMLQVKGPCHRTA